MLPSTDGVSFKIISGGVSVSVSVAVGCEDSTILSKKGHIYHDGAESSEVESSAYAGKSFWSTTTPFWKNCNCITKKRVIRLNKRRYLGSIQRDTGITLKQVQSQDNHANFTHRKYVKFSIEL